MNDKNSCYFPTKDTKNLSEIYQYVLYQPKERLINPDAAQWLYFEMSLDEIENRMGWWCNIWAYENNGYELIARRKCTGYKDKNKKLLFWHDIVKDYFGRLFIIEPCKGAFHMQRIKLFKDGGYHKDSCYLYAMYSENSYEIIGNIYENKELLED